MRSYSNVLNLNVLTLAITTLKTDALPFSISKMKQKKDDVASFFFLDPIADSCSTASKEEVEATIHR